MEGKSGLSVDVGEVWFHVGNKLYIRVWNTWLLQRKEVVVVLSALEHSFPDTLIHKCPLGPLLSPLFTKRWRVIMLNEVATHNLSSSTSLQV